LDVPHLSAYNLTIEEKTVFGRMYKKKQLEVSSEDQFIRQWEYLISQFGKHGYEQYEISNFARDKKYARHNTAYWFGKHYLGIGPSAHSYNGYSRQYNISNNAKYIKNISDMLTFYTKEDLDEVTTLNEYLMTRIRTKWGCDLEEIRMFHGDKILDLLIEKVQPLIESDYLIIDEGALTPSIKGKFVLDMITEKLFFDSNDFINT
jgi:oxygen-independent coproporphyrinogen III oxidase